MSRLVLTDEETVTEVMPGDSAVPTGVQAAAAYIRELLLRPGRYRRKWEQYAERGRAEQVNQLAVAEVLAHYLWQHPRGKGDLDVLPPPPPARYRASCSVRPRSSFSWTLSGSAPVSASNFSSCGKGPRTSACCPARGRSATIRRSCSAAGGSRRSPCTITIISGPTECRSSTALFT